MNKEVVKVSEEGMKEVAKFKYLGMIMSGVRGMEEEVNHRLYEGKLVGFSSTFLFPARNSHPGWNQGERPPDAENHPGSRYHQKLGGQGRPWAHSRYIHVKQK